jgi:hypothetical protein
MKSGAGGVRNRTSLSIWTINLLKLTLSVLQLARKGVMLIEVLSKRTMTSGVEMNFDKWIDSVNDQVHARLGRNVRTQELSWDSAHWVSASGNAVASLNESEHDATITFDNGEKLSIAFQQPEGRPELIGEAIAAHLR